MMKLTSKFIKAANTKKTPVMLTALKQVSKNFQQIQQALPNATIFYAIKANNDPAVINHLHNLGSHFDVASWEEIQLCKKLKISSKRIIYSHPIKPINAIGKAYKYGVRLFTYDSIEEINKLKSKAPNSKVILRLLVNSRDSQCPMFNKFGAHINEALNLLTTAKQAGLNPIGLTFHVGSQCEKQSSWTNALTKTSQVWNASHQANIPLTTINLGGGLPASYHKQVKPPKFFAAPINKMLSHSFPGLKNTYIEPGRFMTNEASVIVSTVIGKAKRSNTEWLYLDVGGFNGLFEIFEHFSYNIQASPHNHKPKKTYAISGPTCDGMDIIHNNITLPKTEIGDKLYILNTGAYSISMRQYNGFKWPTSHTLMSTKEITST